ncbi:Nn.00g021650.m01.CDS01 [Neocucurbitaria sp. VM-36]
MAIWDTLTGRKSSSTAQQTQSSDFVKEDNFQPTPFDPSTAIQNPSEFLYADPSQLHPLAGLNQDTLDYLSLEDSVLSDLPGSQSALPSRGWSDDLCYGTGISYLTALTIGGTWGLAEGLQKNPPTMPPRLRLNGVLNAVTRRGPFLGNSAGVIAMVYNGMNSTIGYYRGKHDMTNSVVAGALSGALFKSTRGTRQMAISSGICASLAGGWAITRKVFFEPDSRITDSLH